MLAFKLSFFSHAVSTLTPMRTYTVDTAMPAATRWNHIFDDPANANFAVDTYAYFHNILHRWTDILTWITKHMTGFFPIEENVEEMKGMADYLRARNPHIQHPLGLLVAGNLLYQLEGLDISCSTMNTTGPCPANDRTRHASAFCSSIVAVDAQNKACLGRNLDWNFPPALIKYIINVNMVHGDVKLFSGAFVLGTVGALHGVNDNFAVSFNARDSGGSVFANLYSLFLKRITPMQLIRETLSSKKSFAEAMWVFTNTDIANPAYFILADGKHPNGAIISRDRTSAADIWYLNETSRKATQQPKWFHVQTNYDPNEEEPSYDARRAPAVQHMQELSRAALNESTLLEVMQQFPTFNPHTEIVSVMCPALQINAQYTRVPDVKKPDAINEVIA
eukprot:GEMP01052339.1.p1 GENE.GEMP01052339.1~~GEMP01052339.1.p1  ORF type:complete len:401 (+),score=76.17 GEMP01052339.1:28-1203(+)